MAEMGVLGSSGKKLIVYHTNWATYDRNFQG